MQRERREGESKQTDRPQDVRRRPRYHEHDILLLPSCIPTLTRTLAPLAASAASAASAAHPHHTVARNDSV